MDVQDFRILGQVQSVHAYCNPVAEAARTGEMAGWSNRRQQAYRKVMTKLKRGGQQLGANAVIGVCFAHQAREWKDDFFELTAVGTAVAFPQDEALGPAPLITTLTGQDIWALHHAGYRPVGCAVGVCAYRQMAHQRIRSSLQIGTRSSINGEHTDFSTGLTKARHLAMSRMTKEAPIPAVAGIIGVNWETTFHHQRGVLKKIDSLSFLLTVMGTPVAACPEQLRSLYYALSLG